jgi:hypothetical protein
VEYVSLMKILSFYSQLRDLMEHADQTKDKDLIQVRRNNEL